MAEFNLREAVESVLESGELASPEAVAAQVVSNLGARQVRAALEQALPGFVRTQMQNRRASNTILAGSANAPARSSKVAGIRDAWANALRDRVHVDGGWKLLGECSYADLMFAAQERRSHAARNLAKADQFESLAARLESAGAATVADLPRGDAAVLEAAA